VLRQENVEAHPATRTAAAARPSGPPDEARRGSSNLEQYNGRRMNLDYPPHIWTPEQVTAFWNYESRFPNRYFTRHAAPGLVDVLRQYFSKSDDVLDYGCGAGHLLAQLLSNGYRAAGADQSPETLAGIERQFAGRPGFLGAASPEAWVASGRRFEAIFVVEVVEHLYDEWLDTLLQTVKQLAKPGGRILFTTPNEEDLSKDSLLCPASMRVMHRMQHVRSWSKETLSSHLEARGLPVMQAFPTDFGCSFAARRQYLRVLSKKLKYWRHPHKKRPHLAVVCRMPA
jgi:SAM-dependent methyltransferase